MTLRTDNRALVADERAQEGRVTEARRRPTLATDYVHTTHPETGLAVVFVPGEALPSWVTPPPARLLEEQTATPKATRSAKAVQEVISDPADTTGGT